MYEKVGAVVLIGLLSGGLAQQAIAAERSGFPGVRRGFFNPFSVRPSVRPSVRISPFALFRDTTSDRVPVATTREPLAAPTLQPAIEGDDEVAPTSSADGIDPPVRSPYRPALRGPF